MKNVEHAALAEQLLANIGNDEFDSPEPKDELLYLCAHHDHGWQSLDEAPPVNEEDGLPYNLVRTPMDYILSTSRGSPDFNEQHSAFCGLLSSMHTYGLYNGRYGLSDAINLSWIPDDKKAAVDQMLDYELARQQKLKTLLQGTGLDDDKLILRAYKYLQFVDACALYFNNNPAGQRGETRFTHVPLQSDSDVEVCVSESPAGSYHFSPYPFTDDDFTLHFEGRYLAPGSLSDDPDIMKKTEIERQYVHIHRN